ncbi:sigma-70 family RNA polymerase sigma factor [Pseudenhygromyxa sp. WMMC2535]|uniref:RNA polymerase sigma factor n=1 Tax=Pseudenhygromyxa sp. WMMC2535 TaxID=2712867 RepID=UPI00155627A8|nr:sigma-70 family RNA polymerase sigma factor [Pseudenhygromyxa sp. WMMC2535]NVB41952.1 sigma-70 family RNA polymerase sigma factor [Pseudenhygromyxa sp. WMMC2535]
MTRDDWQVDASLLEAWRDGDTEAGAALFDRHSDAVARFFENKVREGTDDLIQQTFLRLIEGRARIREGVAVRAFVLGVARNILREHLRKLARGREVDPEVESMAALAPGPTTVVGRCREHRLLLEGLRRLPVSHQIALELFYWEGLNANQIADLLGISHSAMRSRMTRARELLRAAMAEIAESRELLESTVDGLDGWAAQLRGQLGGS